MRTPVRQAASVTLNGAGAGAVVLGPVPTFVRWELTRLAVDASGGTGTTQAEVRVYRGEVNSASLEDSTYAGNLDTADWGSSPVILQAGERLTVAWTGGRPGALATARISGSQEEGA